jgi:hypothetical protein
MQYDGIFLVRLWVKYGRFVDDDDDEDPCNRPWRPIGNGVHSAS